MAGVHVTAGQAYRTGATPSMAVMSNGGRAALQPNTQYTFTSDVEIVVQVAVEPSLPPTLPELEEDVPPDLEAQGSGAADSKRRRGYPDKMVRPESGYDDKGADD